MKTSYKVSVLTASVTAMLGLQAIAADMRDMGNMSTTQQGSAPQSMGEGVIEASAVTMIYTVQNVDAATRMVTLKGSDGTIGNIKCGPQVRNFDQIKAGDTVRATVVDEMAIDIRPGGAGAAPAGGETQTVAVAPKGAKPGMVMIQTEQVSAKIAAIDPNKRLVSLEQPDGMARTIKVSPKVDLSQIKKGDDVTVRVAQGMAITVESPQGSAQPSGGKMMPMPSEHEQQK